MLFLFVVLDCLGPPSLDELKETASKSRGSEGSIVIGGRNLKFKVERVYYYENVQYKQYGEAWDADTDIKVKAKGYKSEAGAREHALFGLIEELHQRNLFK